MLVKIFSINNVKFFKYSVIFILLVVAAGYSYISYSTPAPMIGDETAHYYQLIKQSKELPKVNFAWSVKTAYGKERISSGSGNSMGWEYIGSMAYKPFPYFITVQVYQFLYFFVLILFSYLTVRFLFNSFKASVNVVLLISTLPICLIFGIAFYQDVPVTALLVVTFYFLFRRFYLPAALMLCLSFFIKETAVLMLPAYFLLIIYQEYKCKIKCFVYIIFSLILIGICIIAYDVIVYNYFEGRHSFVIAAILRNSNLLYNCFFASVTKIGNGTSDNLVQGAYGYPGDLRVPINWIIYLGGGFWFASFMSMIGFIRKFKSEHKNYSVICFGIAVIYFALAYIFGFNNPDIRYFLPGIPFLLYSVSFWMVSCRFYKYFFIVLFSLILLQTCIVFSKIYSLRTLGPDFTEVVKVLNNEKPYYDNKKYKIFMYADKWRFLPYEPDWNDYKKVFSFGKKNKTIYNFLKQNKYAFIVIDKSKMASIGSSKYDISIYPDNFVISLRESKYFKSICNNKSYIVYKLFENVQL
jgi:hypothetical protein